MTTPSSAMAAMRPTSLLHRFRRHVDEQVGLTTRLTGIWNGCGVVRVGLTVIRRGSV